MTAVLLVCLGASPAVHAQATPEFLIGSWNVTSSYLLNDGTTEQTAAVATAAEETIGGSTTQIRLTLVGSRNNHDLEIATTFALNPATSQWVMMQADSEAGTVDIGSGSPNAAGDGWTFTSFPATRPDGGLDRFDYATITPDGFVLAVSRSLDGGTAWEPFWTLVFERAPGSVDASPVSGATACAQQEYGQFDFWLGDWDLVSPTGQSSGDMSSVRLASGDCVVEERFLPTTGSGISRSMYDARTGEWARVWIEPGRMLIFVSGGLADGDMIMTGGTTGSSEFTNRTVWQPLSGNRVRQFTQVSTDNGKTWTNSGFDATYVPRGSPSPTPPPTSGGGGGGGSAGLLGLLLAGWLALRHRRVDRGA